MLFIADSTREHMKRPPDDLVLVGELEVRGRVAAVPVWTIADPDERDGPGERAAAGGQATVGDASRARTLRARYAGGQPGGRPAPDSGHEHDLAVRAGRQTAPGLTDLLRLPADRHRPRRFASKIRDIQNPLSAFSPSLSRDPVGIGATDSACANRVVGSEDCVFYSRHPVGKAYTASPGGGAEIETPRISRDPEQHSFFQLTLNPTGLGVAPEVSLKLAFACWLLVEWQSLYIAPANPN